MIFCAGQTQIEDVVMSIADLALNFTPIISGSLIFDAQLTLADSLLSARGLLPVTPGIAIQNHVSGPGLTGAVVSQPSQFFVRAVDSSDSPAVRY